MIESYEALGKCWKDDPNQLELVAMPVLIGSNKTECCTGRYALSILVNRLEKPVDVDLRTSTQQC
jgi:hypothetical protein